MTWRPVTWPSTLKEQTLLLVVLLASLAVEANTRNGFDLRDALVAPEQVHHGGPGRDGIPSIDAPRFVVAADAPLGAQDRVLGVEIGGQARAYPIGILNWHEIVNDRIDDHSIVVSYCPLCGSGVVFRVAGGQVFGVSGLLYNSDVLLYDRATESLWSQLRAEAITGQMKGSRLEMLPVRHTTWARWRADHPNSLVLSTRTGYQRDYTVHPYANYQRSRKLYFPVSRRSSAYHPKEWVIGLAANGLERAYPFAELARQESPLREQLDGRELFVHFDAEARTGWVEEQVGTEMRELPSVLAYWFAWYAFHPDGEVFRAEQSAH